MWSRVIEAIYNNKFNLVITALILVILIATVLPKVDSVAGVKFVRSPSALEKMQSDLNDGYWQVYRDAKREAVRTNVAIETLAYKGFKDFVGDDGGSAPEVYRIVVHSVLRDVIVDFTINTVFRNHFPPLSDIEAVDDHTTRIANVGLQLSNSHVQELWRSVLPEVNKAEYYRALFSGEFTDEVLRIKKESLVRTEVRRMETINNLISVYPELTEHGIKKIWSMK